jgi:hypothetical protein
MDASRENVMEACDNDNNNSNNNKQLQIMKSRRPQLNTLQRQHNIDMYDTRSDVTDMSLMYVFIYSFIYLCIL